jgi:hypothetical protein
LGRVRVKGLALPVEHGGWGFLFEPILMGLAVAPSLAGVLISASAVLVFLLRQPLRVLVTGTEKLAASPRRRWALGLTAAYGAAAAAALLAGLSIAGARPLWALLSCAPLVLVFILYDTQKRSRRLLAELAGPLGLAGSAPAVVLAGGMTAAEAFAVWVLVAARVVPSVLYVRARLKLLRGERAGSAVVLLWHAGFLGVGVLLGAVGLVPYTAGGALGVLLARAGWGLSGRSKATRATQLGIQEIVYGIVYVAIVAVGYWWGDSWIGYRD